ncbi:MAG: hypothetical protein NT154_36275 [Verrucomicrobia bacterium]|nr:hypothetical protein [Verrucomicrobiota bacterium]
MKVSILALSVLVGGAVFASAATTTEYRSYYVYSTTTNVTASFWDISGAAESLTGFPDVFDSSVYCNTDGSGKITGAGWTGIDFNTNYVPFTWFTTDVSGKIAMKGDKTSVTMTIKGEGYTADGQGFAQPTSFNVKFTGQPGPNPDTNSSQKLVILGTMTGTIKGTTPLGNKSAKITNLPAIIRDYNCNLNFMSLNADVLQTMKDNGTGKQLIFGSEYTGNGSIKSGSYKATLKGVGENKGLTLNVEGSMGLYTNSYIGTNMVPFTAPITVNITKGKINGQTVGGLASHVEAHLIP